MPPREKCGGRLIFLGNKVAIKACLESPWNTLANKDSGETTVTHQCIGMITEMKAMLSKISWTSEEAFLETCVTPSCETLWEAGWPESLPVMKATTKFPADFNVYDYRTGVSWKQWPYMYNTETQDATVTLKLKNKDPKFFNFVFILKLILYMIYYIFFICSVYSPGSW